MVFRSRLLLGLILGFTTAAWPQNAADIAAILNHDFQGKVLTQTHFLCGERVPYTADGKSPTAAIGSWTTCGQLRVKAVTLPDDHTIQIQGERLTLIFKGDKPGFRPSNAGKVLIDIASSNVLDEAAARAAMANVFLGPQEHLSDYVPPYWRNFLLRREVADGTRPKAELPPTLPANVSKVGGDTHPPKAIFTPDPDYGPSARQGRYEGTIVLRLVVDETGKPRDIEISRPLGSGLDERAALALATWKFSPAMRNGQPVAVQISVEINFRVY